LCVRCGRPLKKDECPYCRQFPLQIDGLRAVGFFEGVLRDAIHHFKYKHRPELAPLFGGMLAEYFSALPIAVDAVAPVPLHPDRERMRGYNQSLLLARELSLHTGLPMWYNVIKRTHSTHPQVDLDASARRENVRDAFAATDQVAGAHLLLIDDVCTTGATMDACCTALKQCGAKSVWGLALARGR
jgi:ComF family protein